VLAAVAHAVEPDLGRLGITLSMSLGETVPPVPADRDALEHALSNLVSNAIEAMPKGGRLDLTTRVSADGGSVELRVADTGEGISEERRARLFVPFQTSKAAGLGVGLSMAKRSVERLGGRIDVSSRPGAGAVFTITLPMASR